MATWNDLTRRFFPDATDEECNFFLWETTCYPFGRVLTVARQLKKSAKAVKSKQSVCDRCGHIYDNGGKVDFYDLCGNCENLSNSNL